VGTSYLGGKIADALRGSGAREAARVERHLSNAKRIVHTMGQLRGPLMKVGQARGRELVTHFLARRCPPPAQRHFIFLSRVVLG
jgi:hypothetical protein